MMERVETRLDGTTLVVQMPMRFKRRGGRKRIVAPDGSELAPSSKPRPDGTLVKALARAWRWQRLLDDGVYTSVTEISEAEAIGKSYVSRILRLALLAPGIVEEILDGRVDHPLMLEQLERLLPASWVEQRVRIREPKMSFNCVAKRRRSSGPLTVASSLNVVLPARWRLNNGRKSCFLET